MKIKRPLFLLLVVCFSLSVRGAGDSIRYSVTGVFLGGVDPWYSSRTLSIQETRSLAMPSVLLSGDLDGYRFMTFNGTESPRFVMGVNVSRPYSSNDMYTLSFRFGLSYTSSSPYYASFEKSDTIPYDTLTSQQTGNVIYVKKIVSDGYYMSYSCDRLGIHASALIGTNPLRRFSFYTGLSLHYDLTLSASTYIYYTEHTEYLPYGMFNNEYGYSYLPDKEETIRNRTGYAAVVNIPLGMQFRFGKKVPFWKRLYAYYEFSMGMYFEEIPELGTRSGFAPGFMGGYRYYFGKL